jgi:arylsulfatase A-like enzyme
VRPALVLLAVLLLSAVAASAGQEPRPNVLHILIDDMGWSALGCYGGRSVTTPHLDRLAAQGMRFTAAYADAQCSPSRAAFLSGQYGARSGAFKVIFEREPPHAFLRPPPANLAVPPDVASLARTLRKAGYATGISGKWHVADDYSAAPLREKDGGRYFDRYGFDFCGAARESEHPEDKAVTAVTDDILGFIERNKDRPWFAYVAHFTVHTRLSAPRALVEEQVARGFARTTAPDGRFAEQPTAEYLAMLAHLDREVGRLLGRLDELGLAERTVVVFTSDNGGMGRATSNAPLRAAKGSPYEGGIRVPLVVRWPGEVEPGSVCDVPVHAVDFYPTYAALAGAAAPADHELDGESLLPLLRQTGTLGRNALYWHMPSYATLFGHTPCAVVRRGDWKLVHWFGDSLDTRGFTPDSNPYGKLVLGPRDELYDLGADLGETHDLSAEQPERVRELRAALDAWFADTGAGMPVRNPDYDEASWWIDGRAAPRTVPKPR